MNPIRKTKPCCFVSYDGSLCPRHGTPSTAPPGQVEEDYTVGQKSPLTWDEFKINVMKTVEIRENDSIDLHNKSPSLFDEYDLDFEDCNLNEVIKFLQRMARDPNTSKLNSTFTEHITNALIKAREEKIRLQTSIPRKLEDGRDPTIKIKINDFACNALCDRGSSALVMPKIFYDLLDFKPLIDCSLGISLVYSIIKKLLGG